jgi:enamine deaminase RidA (YjgF/YER057c/UK114 family)
MRQTVSSGSAWEGIIGYSRAVRVGNQVFVSGTTATGDDGKTVCVDDPKGQTLFILRKIERALKEAGASLTDVVRTRMFVTDVSRWEEFGRAHGELFGEVRPATTMVEVSQLISPDHLIEIEVDAVIQS